MDIYTDEIIEEMMDEDVISPSEAAFTSSFTSATVVSRDASKVKSTTDTLIVGTLKAKPSNLP